MIPYNNIETLDQKATAFFTGVTFGFILAFAVVFLLVLMKDR